LFYFFEPFIERLVSKLAKCEIPLEMFSQYSKVYQKIQNKTLVPKQLKNLKRRSFVAFIL